MAVAGNSFLAHRCDYILSRRPVPVQPPQGALPEQVPYAAGFLEHYYRKVWVPPGTWVYAMEGSAWAVVGP